MKTASSAAFAVLLLAALAPAQESPWTAPARALAEKIVARAQSRSGMAITYAEAPPVTSADAADARRALDGQLRALGVRLVAADQAVEEVRVTLAQSAHAYVWAAEIGRGDQREVAIVTAPLAPRAANEKTYALALRSTPLLAATERILDVALSIPDAMLVQDAATLSLYRQQSGRWQIQAAVNVPHARPWPRDLRGRLLLQGTAFTAFYPGVQCVGTLAPQFTASCRENDDPWPLTADPNGPRALFNSARNFFTASTQAPQAPGPFFAAARLSQSSNWLFTSLDGNTKLLTTPGTTAATWPGWGSDVVAVASRCGSGSQVITTRTGANVNDAARAFEITGGRANEVAAPLEVGGPITALWPATDGASATMVVRNRETGNYEAASLAIVCGR